MLNMEADMEPLMTVEEDEDMEWIREAAQRRSTANELMHVKRVGTVPPIPEGMKYHFFISHSNDNEEEALWAQRLVDSMEQECGYKFLWPSRDFTPGHKITDLILSGIKHSMKIVCVLTPASINSPWCEYERDLAFMMSLEEGENRIVPIMLEDCEVPNNMRTMNYIDVPRGDDYKHRLQLCFQEHEGLENVIPNMEQIIRTLDITRMRLSMKETVQGNGRQVSIYAEKQTFKGTTWAFNQLSDNDHRRMKEFKNPLSEHVYNKARNIVNQSLHLKYYSLTNSLCRTPCILFLLIMITLLPFVLIILLVEIFHNTIIISGTVTLTKFTIIGFLLAVDGFLLFLFMVVFNFMTFKSARTRILNFSLQQVMRTNVLVNYKRNVCGDPTEYVTEYFLKKSATLEECSEEEKERARRRGEAAVLTYLQNNNDAIFLWSSLPPTNVTRHPTVKGKACLCEMITGT